MRQFVDILVLMVRLCENYFDQFALGTMNAKNWQAMRQVIKNDLEIAN